MGYLAYNQFVIAIETALKDGRIARELENLKSRRRATVRRSVSVAFAVLTIAGALLGPFAGSVAAPVLNAEGTAFVDETTVSETAPAEPAQTFQAVLTQYSRADSCHNMRNGKCLMASGRAVYVGAVACPYFLELGTKIVIDGETYTCEDRYAKWLDKRRGMPTVDVFVDNNPRGRSVTTVTIL